MGAVHRPASAVCPVVRVETGGPAATMSECAAQPRTIRQLRGRSFY